MEQSKTVKTNPYLQLDSGDPRFMELLGPVVMNLAGHTMEIDEFVSALMAVLKHFKKLHPRHTNFGWIGRSMEYGKALVALIAEMFAVIVSTIIMLALPTYGFVILNYLLLLVGDLILVWWGITFIRQLDETDLATRAFWKRAAFAALFFVITIVGEFIDLYFIERADGLNLLLTALIATSTLTVFITSWHAHYKEIIVKPREQRVLMLGAVRSVFNAAKRLTSTGSSVAVEDLNREVMDALFVAVMSAQILDEKTLFSLFGQLAPAQLLQKYQEQFGN